MNVCWRANCKFSEIKGEECESCVDWSNYISNKYKENANSEYPLLTDGWRDDKPQNSKNVLCYVRIDYAVEDKHYHKYYMIEGAYCGGAWFDWMGDKFEDEETVTAWQPLPLPPTVS